YHVRMQFRDRFSYLLYFETVLMIRSSFFSSMIATPQPVSLPFASNQQPQRPEVCELHSPLSSDATQKPEPAGRPRGLPSALTQTRSSPDPVPPFLHVKVPSFHA